MRWFILVFFSSSVFADTQFEKHVQSVSRAMSSFYMYELNEGDSQYWSEFLLYRDQATKSAGLLTAEQKSVYQAAWNNLANMLQFVEVRGQGLSLDEYVRIQFRGYLTQLYLELEKQKSNVSPIYRAYTYSSIVTARSLDLASSHYGPQSLLEEDLKLDPSTVTANIQTLIKGELKNSNSILNKGKLRKLQSRIRFVESSLVNYDQTIPYLLLYSNIAKIEGLIKKTTQMAEN